MRNKASTLIEILFYFTILGVILLASMSFAIQILNVNSLSKNIHELKVNVDAVEELMTYTIQTADTVDEVNSVFDDDGGQLSLNMPSGTATLFYLDSGQVYVQEGAATPVQVTTDAISFNVLRFERLQSDKAPDQIKIEAEANPSNNDLSNLDTTFTINVSISLRK